jgi:oxygen-independent coproporphyrinogen-3 oxidase
LNEYVDCLKIQLRGYADTIRFSSARCGALYIGGGTASLLAPDQVDDLIRTIRELFIYDADVEITLEGNPLDYAREYLQQVKESGVTRLSLGLQSFQDAVLKAVGSAHDGRASREAAKNVRAVGFPTVNIDLLYKLPGQTVKDWHYDLQTALDFEPQSITVYAYVIHPGSAAERLVTNGRLGPPASSEEEQDWYAWTKQQLERCGYVEEMKGYFSKPGHEKKYGEFNYKKCCEYIGLGGGAYSFVNRHQFTTRNEGELYVEQVRQGRFPVADRVSAPAADRNMMERYIMFNYLFSSLDRQSFHGRFGQDPVEVFPHVFAKLKKHHLVTVDEREIRLTDLGREWRENIQNEFYADEFKSPVPA